MDDHLRLETGLPAGVFPPASQANTVIVAKPGDGCLKPGASPSFDGEAGPAV